VWQPWGTSGKSFGHPPSAPEKYYWSVQAVDTGFAGWPSAAEQQFTISPLLINPVHHANGVFEFDFTNQSEVALKSHCVAPLLMERKAVSIFETSPLRTNYEFRRSI
jgi:hypothetical protein